MATGNVPVTSDAKFTLPVVSADVPFPLTTPVSVVAPVTPLATGRVPVRLEIAVDDTTSKSEPFQATTAFVPFAIVTPVVGPAPTILTPKPPVVLLITMYALLLAGAVMVRSAEREPVQFRMICRA